MTPRPTILAQATRRNIFIEKSVWAGLVRKAAAEGRSTSSLVREAIREYLKK